MRVGLLARRSLRVDRRRQIEHGDRRAAPLGVAVRVERREHRRLRRRRRRETASLKTSFAHVAEAGHGPEVGREPDDAAAVRRRRAARARRCRCRCRRGGSGRSTASGRRRRRARRDEAALRADRRRRSSAASRNMISAWTGSVSWNSSTKSQRYFCCSARRTSAFVAQDLRGEDQQVVEAERVAAPALGLAPTSRALIEQRDASAVEILAPRGEVRQDRRCRGSRRAAASACLAIGLVGPPLLRDVRLAIPSICSSSTSSAPSRRPRCTRATRARIAPRAPASCTSSPDRSAPAAAPASVVQNSSSAFHAVVPSGIGASPGGNSTSS